MVRFRLFSVLLFALYTDAQIQTPPANVSTGFIKLRDTGIQPFVAAPRIKQVSFFYTPTGLVAYDGDIIFGTIDEFDRALVNITYDSLSNTTHTKRTNEKRHHHGRPSFAVTERSNSIFPGSSGIWPGSKISYRYVDDGTESQLSPYVKGAIDAWTAAVPCLSFEKLPNSNDASNSNGIVNIVAHNPNVGACFASIGYGPYSLWMSLDTGGGCGVAEVTHEWGKQLQNPLFPDSWMLIGAAGKTGHILGLMHEQKRPDSFKYDRFVCANLIDYPFGLVEADANGQCCGAAPNYGCCGWACQFTPDFGYYNEQDPCPRTEEPSI